MGQLQWEYAGNTSGSNCVGREVDGRNCLFMKGAIGQAAALWPAIDGAVSMTEFLCYD